MAPEAVQDSMFAASDPSPPAAETSPGDDGGAVKDAANSNRPTIALACMTCRSRHLKCDGKQPCERCRMDEVECQYIKSRRGYKGPRKAKTNGTNGTTNGTTNGLNGSAKESATLETVNQPLKAADPVEIDFSAPPDLYIPPMSGTLVVKPQNTVPMLPQPTASTAALTWEDNEIADTLSPSKLPSELTVNCWPAPLFVNSYYENFHHCHPFLLPRKYMLALLQSQNMPHLVLGMQYIGSFYYPSASTTLAQDALSKALASTQRRDAVTVQAMLLLTIGLQMADRTEQASLALFSTLDLAVELGMNKREFSWVHGNFSPVLEESWRRTWWEIYFLSGLMCGMNGIPFKAGNVVSDCALPCEEHEYENGNVPRPRNVDELEDADFFGPSQPFSSGAYRVDSIRRCGFCHSVVTGGNVTMEALDNAETIIANWRLRLPESKKDPVDRNGVLDEMMFQAHMMNHAAGVMLNRPRSDLNLQDVVAIQTCVGGPMCVLPGEQRQIYTAKAIQSAHELIRLMTLPVPLLRHTPFFCCLTTGCASIYLAYWSFCATDGSDTSIKEQIKLTIGVLKNMSELWPLARKTLGQVQGVAQELYAARKAINSVNWEAVTSGEIIQHLVELTSSENGESQFDMDNIQRTWSVSEGSVDVPQ